MITEEFVESLARSLPDGSVDICSPGNLFAYGRKKGWLEAQDELSRNNPLSRQSAARIGHEFLRKELGEADEADWGSAKELLDLYDCRVCANHIAQVYAKGIMTAARYQDGRPVFDAKSSVGEEGILIVERLLYPEKRGKMVTNRNAKPKEATPQPLSMASLKETCDRYDTVLLLDVRSIESYEQSHFSGAIHVLMTELLEKPVETIERLTREGAGNVTDKGADKESGEESLGIFLFCEKGVISEIAANCLMEAGYQNVYYLGLVEDAPARKEVTE